MEAHGSPGAKLAQQVDRPAARRGRRAADGEGRRRPAARALLAIDIVRRGGTISLIGVYGGMADPLPMLTMFDKQIQLRMGQANVKRWAPDILPLLDRRRPARRRGLRHAPAAAATRRPQAYETFQKKAGRRGQGPASSRDGGADRPPDDRARRDRDLLPRGGPAGRARGAAPARLPVLVVPVPRACMPALGDRWRLLAPDLPGLRLQRHAGPGRLPATRSTATRTSSSASPTRCGLERYALYLHDYGSQIGLRLAMRAPERVAALIIQNGDIYEDELGPKYAPLKALLGQPDARGPRRRWPTTSARTASATSSSASCRAPGRAGAAPTCGRCTGA